MQNLDNASDAVVIRRSLADPTAFGTIFERHFDSLYAYARRRIGVDLAEEIATEAFTRAFDRRRTFDLDRADARPWLLGIAANLLKRHWRTERRKLESYARSADRASPPHESAHADVVAALDGLSRDERETLFLFAVADLSYEEIAQALAIPIGTVRSRLARARGRVRARLREHPPRRSSTPDPKESFNV